MAAAPRSLASLLALAVLFSASACRDGALALGHTPAEARAHAGEIFGAFEARFGDIKLDPVYLAARPKFARDALTPSRIADDSSVWTSIRGNLRTFELLGAPAAGGRYLLAAHHDAPPPTRAGEYRQALRLTPLGDGAYEWRGRDELAIGSASADELGDALSALFRAAQRSSPERLRASYRGEMPRTTAAIGRLFSLDSVAVTPAADGASAITLVIALEPKRLAPIMPYFAKYLAKYASPSSFSLAISDDDGRQWLDVRAEHERLTLKFRVHGGDLAPLNAAPHPIPSTLKITGDALAKVGLFTVGVRRLAGDLTLIRTPHENGWLFRFRRAPEWVLPPLVGTMLKSPLRRPFEDEGASLGYAIVDSGGGPTLVTRDFHLVVKESAILRFLQKLSSSSLGDFRGAAEREAALFVEELFAAMRADVAAMAHD
ncbi:MAG: hypothetical protein ABJD07_04590 [Gemmatimonadaceae bacterium]